MPHHQKTKQPTTLTYMDQAKRYKAYKVTIHRNTIII